MLTLIFRFCFDDVLQDETSFFHNYLANFIIPLCETDPWSCQVSWCRAVKLCIRFSCPDVGNTELIFRLSSLEPLTMSSLTSWLAFDTDLSSALCLTPSAAGFITKKRSVKLGSVSDAWEAGSSRPVCTSSSSVRLPDRIQDLHHLLIDDENYGHIQTHTAQPRNCPFIETTDGQKESGEYTIYVFMKRHIYRWLIHLYIQQYYSNIQP